MARLSYYTKRLLCWPSILLALQTFIATTPALAILEVNNLHFSQPVEVRTQLRFWEKIFSGHASTIALIHDSENLDHIVDIIDFDDYVKRYNQGKMIALEQRTAIANRYLERYNLAISRFKKQGQNALANGAIEQRLFNVYYRRPALLKRLYQGETKLRVQTGLSDSLVRAADTAQQLLPTMEKIFEQENVPAIMTRIAFVESMFNMKARSKVGASGIWQFMPATARQYLVINRLIDERLSPLKATRAAARLLRDNYEALGTWPLAITAYNHGTNGMKGAVRKVGSQDIGEIIRSYQSPSFGFASRNFYSEFLAASRSFEKMRRNGTIQPRVSDLSVSTIRLIQKLSIKEIITNTSLNEKTLAAYNSCLRDEAFSTYRDDKLPSNFELIVPKHLAKDVVGKLNTIGPKRYAIK